MKRYNRRLSMIAAGTGLLFCLALGGSALAAPGGRGATNPEARQEQRIEHMRSQLGLSSAQAQKIRAIIESHRAGQKALEARMKETLTPEQQAKIASWRQERKNGERLTREQRKERRASLGVTEAQKSQMAQYRKELKANRVAMREEVNAVLTPEQRAKAQALKAERKDRRTERRRR